MWYLEYLQNNNKNPRLLEQPREREYAMIAYPTDNRYYIIALLKMQERKCYFYGKI